MSMPGLPGIELPLICLGELNAPKSCWRVVGTRQRSACREEFAPSLQRRHWRSSRVATYLRVIIWGSSYIVLDFKAVFFSFGEEVCGFCGSGKKGHAR